MSAYAANLLVEQLPQTDYVVDLKSIVSIQLAIINGVIEHKSFNLRDLEDFSDKCENIIHKFEPEEE